MQAERDDERWRRKSSEVAKDSNVRMQMRNERKEEVLIETEIGRQMEED